MIFKGNSLVLIPSSNVCFKKTWTSYSTVSLLWFVQTFLKQTLWHIPFSNLIKICAPWTLAVVIIKTSSSTYLVSIKNLFHLFRPLSCSRIFIRGTVTFFPSLNWTSVFKSFLAMNVSVSNYYNYIIIIVHKLIKYFPQSNVAYSFNFYNYENRLKSLFCRVSKEKLIRISKYCCLFTPLRNKLLLSL